MFVSLGCQGFLTAFFYSNRKEISLKITHNRQLYVEYNEMNSNQLERLKKDERELGHYQARLNKEGKSTLAHRIQRKKEYLMSRIHDLEEEYFLAS